MTQGAMGWLQELTEIDRRALVFSSAYEKARRSHGQFGYRAFPELGPDVVDLPAFKQFRTVVRWLAAHGWKTSLSEFHWVGYVEFAFRVMKPVIPMPGQLRNQRMLRDYLKSSPQEARAQAPGLYTYEELEELYKKKLRPELRNRGAILASLKLRQLSKHSAS